MNIDRSQSEPVPNCEGQSLGGISLQVAVAAVSRFLLNTSRRFVYPFAPEFSRNLAVSVSAITSLIAVNQLTAILGIFIGPLIDRLGYRRVMLAGMAILCLGMGWAALSGSYWGLLVGLVLAGTAKTIYDPAVQAYIGSKVVFANRGKAIGLLELAWSASTLLGIPLAALSIERWGWRAPFFFIAFLGALGLVSILWVFVKDSKPEFQAGVGDFGASLTGLARNKVVAGAMVWAFLVSLANDNLFVVYGFWLEDSFAMGVVALGFSTGLIGLAEMLAEGMTVSLGDKVGLQKSVLFGCIVTTASYLFLPLAAADAKGALAGLFILFLAFEFTMVASICLATELMPGARATMMSGFYAAAGLGRVVGAVCGAIVWQAGGIWATGAVSAISTALAGCALFIGLAGWSPDKADKSYC